MKKVFAILTSLCMFIVSFGMFSVYGEENEVSKNEKAQKQIIEIKESLSLEDGSYDDNYAGAWIDESGNAYIAYTNNNSNIRKMKNEYTDVEFTYHNNSFNQLLEFQSKIDESNLASENIIYGNQILEDENALQIDYKNVDDLEYIKTVVKDINYNNVSVLYKQGYVQGNTASLDGGHKITNGSGTCSVGFRATKNGSAGFVTAGHCFSLNNSISQVGGSNVGKVTVRSYGPSNNMDAEFVLLSSGNTINKRGRDSVSSVTNYSSKSTPIQGQLVKHYGLLSVQKATIKSVSASANFTGDGYYTNLILTNGNAIPGWSGGLVIMANNSINPTSWYAVGINKGGSSGSFYVVKIDSILSKLGLGYN